VKYPQTRKSEQLDTYHGTHVADPYRWLEDDNSAETLAWVNAQNAVTFDYLDKIPYRPKLKQRTLITTADHDDRVVPAHSFKYAAALQENADPANPVLIRIDTQSGHGASNTSKALDTAADVYSFIMFNLGVTPTLPPSSLLGPPAPLDHPNARYANSRLLIWTRFLPTAAPSINMGSLLFRRNGILQ
jgi:protease II